MKAIKQLIYIAVLGAGAALSLTSWAQQLAEGEVRKVDRENRKITLKHGEIKDLDMPAMTMVFQVSDPALLEKVKPGDKVKFTAISDGGKLTVTGIQPAR